MTKPLIPTNEDPARGVVYAVEMPAMPVDKAEEMRPVIEQALAREAYSLNLHVAVMRKGARPLSRRERAMLAILEQALLEIQHELNAAGPDEVASNPYLESKQQWVDVTERRLAQWRGETPGQVVSR